MTVVVHLRRVLVLRVEVDEKAIGLEALKVDLGVEHVGELRRHPGGAANAEPFPPQIRAPISDAEAHALARSHAPENELTAVGTFAGTRPVEETAFDETIDLVDER